MSRSIRKLKLIYMLSERILAYKNIGITMVLALSIGISGCSLGVDSKKLNQLVNDYESSGNVSDGKAALDFIRSETSRKLITPNEGEEVIQRALMKVSDIAYRNKDYDFFFFSKNIYRNTDITDAQYTYLSQEYDGDIPQNYLYMARWHSLSARHHSAYKFILKAIELDHDYSGFAIELLSHFGCMDTAAIWAEYYNEDSYSSYELEGTEYPKQASLLGSKGIIDGRIQLRKGFFPSLEEGCPILQFD